METNGMTDDAKLGQRVTAATSFRSLTVTPDGNTSPSSLPTSDVAILPEVKTALRRRKEEKKKTDEKGLRGKFLRYLEGEARRKREMLSEVKRRSICVSGQDSETLDKLKCISGEISDELECLEELCIENSEALIHEQMECLHDRRASTAPASSAETMPMHWRARAPMRRTPLPARRTASCSRDTTSSTMSIEAEMRNSAGSTSCSKMCALASEAYCDKVSTGVRLIMRPIDKMLSKISVLVYGHASSQRTSAQRKQPQAAKKSSRAFWEHMACGACANTYSDNTAANPNPPVVACTSANTRPLRDMEYKNEVHTQASLAKFERQVAESERDAVLSLSAQATVHDSTNRLTDYVPVSSLDESSNERKEILEAVVQLSTSISTDNHTRVDSALQDRDPALVSHHHQTSLEETRRVLFKSLGRSSSPSNSSSTRMPLHVGCSGPQPLSAPGRIKILELGVQTDRLSPVSIFLAEMFAMEKVI